VAAIVLACAPAAHAANRNFREVVRGVETTLGAHSKRIPMLSLFGIKAVLDDEAKGRGHFDFATFEDLAYSPGLEQRFRAAVRSSLGAGWCPLLQVHSPSRHEFTGIFVSGSQSDYRVILATLEAHEATLVELHVGPREMLSWLTEPGKQRRHKGGGADHEDKDEDRDQQ